MNNTLTIRSHDELIAYVPHLLGFQLFWTTDPRCRCSSPPGSCGGNWELGESQNH